MTTWTVRDSERLDRQIRRDYPNRTPLRRDPALAELLEEPINEHFLDTCVVCDRQMWRSDTPKPIGVLRHIANGKCSTCYGRERTGAKPRKYRIPRQATA